MSTRAIITFRNEMFDPVCCIYKHCDGYIDGLGHSLAEWLMQMTIINGIGSGERTHDYANGIGCLAAKWIADNKTETGDIYLCAYGDYQDYNYDVIMQPNDGSRGHKMKTDDCIRIEIRKYDEPDLLFSGSPSELLNFNEDDEDSSTS